ncbi:LLM class flavin-dependent oxidoreductase [Verticiella sediminum]|uniref:LLM class flavin-dependent oxidoreductase n=1 Tax=Verticiella sediminum TaxID=1247510 RepID=A0A556AQ24_9BURK|nr:LLM class flavin-dependent oxidoreductase [Verticiella sediminum]TSH94980.1 LLM class flavin-dependent oxidoreductase [Verticiella sediminum]
MRKHIKLAMSIWRHGYHVAAWRLPEVPADSMMNIRRFIDVAKAAERGKFDLVFMADVLGSHYIEDDSRSQTRGHTVVKNDPLQVLSAIATHTQKIGLVSTISTTYGAPYTTARAFATLDQISGGRSGWNIVTSYNLEEARNFGLEKPPESAERAERALEYIDVVKGLWDTWADDAFPVDKQNAVYVDRKKMHVLAHEGKHFKVRGPLDVPRSPQGQPVLVTAGDSDNAINLAGRHAHIAYAGQPVLESARKYYQRVKAKAAEHGRAHEVSVLPGIMPYVGETEAEAYAKMRKAQDLVTPAVGFALMKPFFGDLSHLNISDPFPLDVEALQLSWNTGHFSKMLQERARADKFTVEDMYKTLALGEDWHITMAGTPKRIVDKMEEWIDAGAADGFNVQPPDTPGSVNDFVDMVIPELQRRGLFRTEYEGTTLRDHLGLPRPRNVYF